MMAFLNKGLEIRFKDERPEHKAEPVTYKYAGGIIDFVKHLNTSKEALFSKVGYYELAEEEQEVEIAFQWNTGYNADGIHSFANGINTTEGGSHEEGFKAALTTVVNKHARAKNLLKEKEPEPPRRGHPRGHHRDHLGAPARPAVRGPDEGQARQHEHQDARAEGHQRQARPVVRGEPHRGQQDGEEGARRRPGPHGGQEGARRHPLQDPARRRRHARQAQGLQLQEPRGARAVHRRGRLGRRLRRQRPRPAAPGDPARSAARS